MGVLARPGLEGWWNNPSRTLLSWLYYVQAQRLIDKINSTSCWCMVLWHGCTSCSWTWQPASKIAQRVFCRWGSGPLDEMRRERPWRGLQFVSTSLECIQELLSLIGNDCQMAWSYGPTKLCNEYWFCINDYDQLWCNLQRRQQLMREGKQNIRWIKMPHHCGSWQLNRCLWAQGP